MKRFVSWTLSAAVLLAAASACRADEEFKPLVAVFASGLENVGNKVSTVCQSAASPFRDGSRGQSGRCILCGQNMTAPCGEFVVGDKEGQAAFCVFFPISNVEGYVAYTEKSPNIDSLELNEGVYEGRSEGRRRVLRAGEREMGLWAGQPRHARQRTADPLKLLDDLPKRFDVGVKIFPEHYRGLLPKVLELGSNGSRRNRKACRRKAPAAMTQSLAAANQAIAAARLGGARSRCQDQ